MAALLTLLLLAAAIAIVASPLLRGQRVPGAAELPVERAELEAAREAKYREIRDAELDYRTGKLSREDYEAIDATLRAEAVAILDALEAFEATRRDPATPAPGSDFLKQQDRVQGKGDREADRPAVEVALDHRAAAQRSLSAADPERP